MKTSLLAALLVLFGISAVHAQEEALKKETVELGVASSALDGALSPFIGYFFSDYVEGIIHVNRTSLEINLPDTGNDVDVRAVSVSADLVFNFPTNSRFVPLLGIGVFYSKVNENDITSDITGMDLTAGFRYFFAERASVNIIASTAFLDTDVTNGSTISGDVEGTSIGLAYSIFFN